MTSESKAEQTLGMIVELWTGWKQSLEEESKLGVGIKTLTAERDALKLEVSELHSKVDELAHPEPEEGPEEGPIPEEQPEEVRPDRFSLRKLSKRTALTKAGKPFIRNVLMNLDIFDSPPTEEDIRALYVPIHGGGRYFVVTVNTKKLVAKYSFPEEGTEIPTSEKEKCPITFDGNTATVPCRAHNCDEARHNARVVLDEYRPNLQFIECGKNHMAYRRVGFKDENGMLDYNVIGAVKERKHRYISRKSKPKTPSNEKKGLEALFENQPDVFVDGGVVTMEKPEPKGYGQRS